MGKTAALMNLKKTIFISIALHSLIFLPWLLWLWKHQSPLPGGGGGSGSKGHGASASHVSQVSIDMLAPAPLAGELPILKKISKNAKPSSPINTSASRTSGPRGPGSGSGEGLGSGTGDGTNQTLALILSKIEKAKRYPELAQRAGISGRALVAFQINAEGKAENIILKNSAGSAILDEEAKATITRAAPYPLYTDPLEIWIKFEQVSN